MAESGSLLLFMSSTLLCYSWKLICSSTFLSGFRWSIHSNKASLTGWISWGCRWGSQHSFSIHECCLFRRIAPGKEWLRLKQGSGRHWQRKSGAFHIWSLILRPALSHNGRLAQRHSSLAASLCCQSLLFHIKCFLPACHEATPRWLLP